MLVCALSLVAGMAAAAPTELDPRAGLNNSKTPWAFSCDEVKVYNKENRTQCRGHVVVTRDDIKITCDLFEAFTDAKNNLRRMVCVENVVLMKADGKSTSEKAEFETDNQTLTLTGSPVVTQGPREFRGDVIVYDLKNDRLSVRRLRGKIGPEGVPSAAGGVKK
jgi:lipopolysaccharide transport protein LptA